MKNNIKEKLSDILELPQDALGDIPKITLFGNELMIIENHRGIRIYDADKLVINTPLGFVKITGANFALVRFEESLVAITGEIKSFGYVAEDGDG